MYGGDRIHLNSIEIIAGPGHDPSDDSPQPQASPVVALDGIMHATHSFMRIRWFAMRPVPKRRVHLKSLPP